MIARYSRLRNGITGEVIRGVGGMSDIVNEAAQILVPLVTAGANAAVQEASKEAGRGFVGAARSLIRRMRDVSTGKITDVGGMAVALRSGLDEGSITHEELTELVNLYHLEERKTQVTIYGDKTNSFVDTRFNGSVSFNNN